MNKLVTSLLCFGLPVLAQAKPFAIVVSHPTIQYLIKHVSCDSSSISTQALISKESDAHHFFITPKHRASLEKSDLNILYFPEDGVGKKLSKSVMNKTVFLFEKKDVELLTSSQREHFWLSPRLVTQAAEKIAMSLEKKGILSNEKSTSCRQSWEQKKQDTLKTLKDKIEKIPQAKKSLAFEHDVFDDFAKEFNFKYIALESAEHEHGVSPQKLSEVIKFMRENNTKIFYTDEPNLSGHIRKVLKETQASSVTLYNIDGTLEDGDILKIWTENFSKISDSLHATK